MAAELSIVIAAKDEASKAMKSIGDSASGMGKVLGDVGKIASGFIAANVIQAGASQITGFFNDSIKAQRESIAVGAQLEAVLKSTGGAAGVTAQQAKDLASAIEKNSKFEDEAVLSGESLLLTFTSIGKDVFPEATQTMVDMSQALGQDMKSSAVQLGKALNDPIQGVTALRRVGVSFTEDQLKQIATMQKSGDLMGAQKLILGELSKEFGGSAKAASDADAANEKYKDRMHDLQEQIGAGLIPIQDKLKVAEAAAIGFISSQVLPVLESFSKYIKFVVSDGDTMNDWLSHMPKFLQPAAVKIGELVVWFKDKFIPAMQDVVSFVSDHWPLISKVIEFGADFVKAKIEGFIQTFKGIVEIVSGTIDLVQDLFHGRWSDAWDDMKKIASGVLDLLIGYVKEQFGNMPQLILGLAEDAAKAAGQFAQKIFDGVVNTLEGLPAKMAQLGKDAANSFLDSISIAGISAKDVANVVSSIIPHHALGGPAGGLTWVGEQGPELVSVPNGSYVHNNRDSMAMVNSGGSTSQGGDIHVSLTINGGVWGLNDLDDRIRKTIRDAIAGGGFRGYITSSSEIRSVARGV